MHLLERLGLLKLLSLQRRSLQQQTGQTEKRYNSKRHDDDH